MAVRIGMVLSVAIVIALELTRPELPPVPPIVAVGTNVFATSGDFPSRCRSSLRPRKDC